ncbi:hypothetical protein C8J57DRAFT_1230643 [Mycena rebaudengoi]|nr:hypothetical protein C8J57DRAFT_1230643 [Mycena rebaudengoi]
MTIRRSSRPQVQPQQLRSKLGAPIVVDATHVSTTANDANTYVVWEETSPSAVLLQKGDSKQNDDWVCEETSPAATLLQKGDLSDRFVNWRELIHQAHNHQSLRIKTEKRCKVQLVDIDQHIRADLNLNRRCSRGGGEVGLVDMRLVVPCGVESVRGSSANSCGGGKVRFQLAGLSILRSRRPEYPTIKFRADERARQILRAGEADGKKKGVTRLGDFALHISRRARETELSRAMVEMNDGAAAHLFCRPQLPTERVAMRCTALLVRHISAGTPREYREQNWLVGRTHHDIKSEIGIRPNKQARGGSACGARTDPVVPTGKLKSKFG